MELPSRPEGIDDQSYLKLLQIYARSHRKDGKPYLAEALHPDTGSFEGHDGYNHSEHYFHSGYCDLIITGLVGLKPRADDVLEIVPLAPDSWEYFALDDVSYHGHRVSILWDKQGTRYQRGTGFQVLVDGVVAARSEKLERLTAKLPAPSSAPLPVPAATLVNYAVNNDGDYFPRISTSHTGQNSSPAKLIDGNYWYHAHPPNRWTAAGSQQEQDWVEIDLGMPRKIHTVKLYFLDDGNEIVPPQAYEVEYWQDGKWQTLPKQERALQAPTGRRPNVIKIPETAVSKLRVVLSHVPHKFSGMTEIELWGDATLPVEPAAPPTGNLAFNAKRDGFPKATASFSDRYGGTPEKAIDGKIVYPPTPMNRWTSYGSPQASDWFEVDFGAPQQVSRAELHIYDDRGGVQPPAAYTIEYLDGETWKEVANAKRSPEKPAGSTVNTVRFESIKTTKLRVIFTHQGQARSGLTELEIWKE